MTTLFMQVMAPFQRWFGHPIANGCFDKTRQPAGDSDCKLSVKKRRNASPRLDHPRNSGAPAQDGGGDLLGRRRRRRRHALARPHRTWDVAYDAHDVYDNFGQAGGGGNFAAVPFNAGKRGAGRQFCPDGTPLCAAGLPMHPQMVYLDRSNGLVPHERAKYQCPLPIRR
ncbi:hypothetical protein [Candidatus Oscillochloris fontis]|uniref:hypothetical protein n=1 Tax=Candidatus Oscillochloris fontis TaxID=2496868 RepID=UPI00101BBFAF|nr:hypothetical protein [Candidatus Oscillochloris fontis]